MKQYFDHLDKTLRSEVESQMMHLKGLGDLFTQSFDSITLTERGHMMTLMLTATRRLKKSVESMERKQASTLLQIIDFDPRGVKSSLEGIVNKLNGYITQDELVGDVDEEDWDWILDKDDKENLLSPANQSSDERFLRKIVIRCFDNNYHLLQKSADEASIVLQNISLTQRELEKDEKRRKSIFEAMDIVYERDEWPRQKENLDFQLNEEIQERGERNMTESQVLEYELKRLVIDNTVNIYKKALVELNSSVKDKEKKPAEIIWKYRDELTEVDLNVFFCYRHAYQWIQETIDIQLLQLRSDYDMLFTNRASQEYVELLIPVLRDHSGITDKGHYGVLQLVLQDLRLVRNDKKNGLQMMEFVNKKMIVDEEEKLPSQDSITKITRKMQGKSFARLGTVGLKSTNIKDENEYSRMKEVYWCCFAILNDVGLVDVETAGFDSYLNEKHGYTTKHDMWEGLDFDTRNRLNFLRSVLRGETPHF